MPDTAEADAVTPDTADTATADTGSADAGAAVSFAAVYEKVIKAKGCSGGYCHGGGAGALLLSDQATSHKNLTASAQVPACGATQLVVPGKPELSMLWLRVRPASLNDDKGCGPKMPKGSKGLSEELAELVKSWIEDGAKP